MKKKSKKKLKQKKINFIDILTSHPELFEVPFLIDDIITALWDKEEGVVKVHASFELQEYLDDCADFIEIEDEEILYYHIPTFFEGKEFSVKPTKDEIDEGILYPGHRFIPYISEDVHASDAELFDGDSLIPTTIVTKQLDELSMYHSLLGIDGMVQYFIIDDIDNMPDLQVPLMKNSEFNVTVMNMKDYYQKHNFKSGDTIIMKIDNFYEGIVSMRYHSSEKAKDDKGKILKWCGLFSEGLNKAIGSNGPEMTIYEELTTTILLNSDYLLNNPVIHIGGFLELSKKFEIQHLDDHAIIWNKDDNAQDKLDDIYDSMDIDDDDGMDFDTIMDAIGEGMSEPPEIDDIDSMMEYMGFHFREDELHAYMLDELFNDGNSLDNVWERCFDDRITEYPRFKEYEQPLRECLKQLWDDIAGSYNRFNDDHRGKIRTQALKIVDKQTLWMRSLNEKIDDISELSHSKFAELAETSSMLTQIIVMLNDQDEEFSKKDGKQIVKTLDAFALMIDQMQDNVTL